MAKRKSAAVKLNRLEARIRVIKGTTRIVFVLFCLSVGFVVVATAVPQRRELLALQSKLEEARGREGKVLADRNYHEIEYRALREDPDFLEIQARDRLEVYHEGERVLKFKRHR